jgi:hypothetical protein
MEESGDHKGLVWWEDEKIETVVAYKEAGERSAKSRVLCDFSTRCLPGGPRPLTALSSGSLTVHTQRTVHPAQTMAFVMQPAPLEFHPAPVSHSPSPLGFSFGLSNPLGSHPHTPITGPHASPFHNLASVMSAAASPAATPTRKRRHEGEDDENEHAPRDVSMGRSPTPPDRLRKPAPKRVRPQVDDSIRLKGKGKGNDSHNDGDVDVGVLLGKSHDRAHLLVLLITSLQPHSLQQLFCPSSTNY